MIGHENFINKVATNLNDFNLYLYFIYEHHLKLKTMYHVVQRCG